MPKLTEEKIKQIIVVLDKADFAINTLERANSNRMIFPETKRDVQQLSEELKSRYSSELKSKGINDEDS